MKHFLAPFLMLATLAGCQESPTTSAMKADTADQPKFIETVTSSSESSVAAIIFSALEEYSETAPGSSLVEFGAREPSATELSLVIGKDEIHCQRYRGRSDEEYSCQMSKSINTESETADSVQAHLIYALVAFSEIPGTAGYSSIYFGENDFYTTEFSFKSSGEKFGCSRYMINSGESFGCFYSKR
jgi:hypothetical protein